ncbi:MAG TPA: circadian clock KaiB family protein [Lichenihabitans sp.]|nr:circadian clock KaiB family protein [Lichenihabitans sp.]
MNAAGEAAPGRYRLRLFVAGMTLRSRRTIEVLRRICLDRLDGRYDLEIVDIYQQQDLAEANQIIAAPTLLKLSPQPQRRIIGDLSDEARLLRGLGLPAEAPGPR